MVKLTFIFNEKKLKSYNMTKEDVLLEMRKYAKENNIIESSFGVFEKDGEHALCLLSKFAVEMVRENLSHIDYLKKLELDIDGEKEDCIKETKNWLKKRNVI